MFFKKISRGIGFRLGIGFSIIVLLTFIQGVISLMALNRLAENTTRMYNHPLIVSHALRDLSDTVRIIHSSMVGAILSRDSSNIAIQTEDIIEHERKINASFEIIKKRFLGDMKDVEDAIEAFSTWIPIRQEMIKLIKSDAGSEKFEALLIKNEHQIARIDQSMCKLIDFAQQKAVELHLDAQHTRGRCFTLILVSFLLIIGAGTIVAIKITKNIATPIHQFSISTEKVASGDLSVSIDSTREDEIGVLARHFNVMVKRLHSILSKLHRVSAEVANASSSIMEAVQEQLENTKQQALTVSRTTSSALELSKTSEQIGNSIGLMSDLTGHVLSGMSKISDANETTASIISSLHDKSKTISQISELINDIAEQTNLLAVNASVEAARAGVHGRGFTVVADEIRKLADSTAKSTKDISSVVELIHNDMANALISIDKSRFKVGEEAELTNKTASRVNDIVEAAKKQIQGSDLIAQAMTTIDNNMKHVVNGAQQSQEAVIQLKQLVTEMEETLIEFNTVK